MKKIFVTSSLILASFLASPGQTENWSPIEKVFERKGAVQGDVFKVTFPRTDLKVTVGEVTIEPGLALTSWIAFKPMDNHVMMMGDLVLLESEVAPVMEKLVASGLEASALHNHLTNETPKIMYLHFGGQGKAIDLAEKMKGILALTKTPIGPLPLRAERAEEIDWSSVEAMFGFTGQRKGRLLQFGIPRFETITENGVTLPPFMGVTTAINMQRVGEKIATTGDFVLLAGEVNPVVKALTENGIAVTAIHNHMLNESPRLFMLHFWGNDRPELIARGLRAALDKTNSQKK